MCIGGDAAHPQTFTFNIRFVILTLVLTQAWTYRTKVSVTQSELVTCHWDAAVPSPLDLLDLEDFLKKILLLLFKRSLSD